LLLATALFLTLLAPSSPALAQMQMQTQDWKPILPADLALATPVVQPDADAEALLWEVRVADDDQGGMYDFRPRTVFDHYLRVKIFTERGREAHATVDLPYTANTSIEAVAARTIKADGTAIELKKSDVHKRTLLKGDGLKVKAVSFALPAIVVGSIVEYRWREVHEDSLASNLVLPFSRDIPVQLVRYYFKPLKDLGAYQMWVQAFNGDFTPAEHQRDGFSMTSLTNVKANREEPFSAPLLERQPWVFVSYGEGKPKSGPDYWTNFSKRVYEAYSKASKPNDAMKKVALEAVAAAGTPRARVAALIEATRTRMTRIDLPTTPDAVLKAAKENKNAADAFEHGQGTRDDVLTVFVALATAAGLDARVVAAPDRDVLFFQFDRPMPYLARGRLVAVRDGEGWLFVDPANPYSASGALRWYHEWQPVLVSDPKELILAKTPLSPPEYSVRRRVGTFTLTEDGTLEGQCQLVYTGHLNQVFKSQDEQDTPEQLADALRERFAKRLPGATVTDVTVEHLSDPALAYTSKFRIKVPGYAQRTGSRMFLQPALFEKGLEATFASERRDHDVYFPYAWSENDVVSITLPDGYELETPSRPPPLTTAVGKHELIVGTTDGWKTLQMRRTFSFGLGEALSFGVTGYPALKRFFDLVSQSDGHTIVLRKKDAAPKSAPPDAADAAAQNQIGNDAIRGGEARGGEARSDAADHDEAGSGGTSGWEPSGKGAPGQRHGALISKAPRRQVDAGQAK
jgi:transglutaminase-like putative cysteine protease